MIEALTHGPMNLMVVSLIGWLVFVNVLTFLAFYLDHRRAVSGYRETPGGTLVVLATMGGWLGAQFGRLLFDGANRRGAFVTVLNLSILPMLALTLGLAAMDVDWSAVMAQIVPQPAAPVVEPVAVVAPAPRPLPAVLNLKKAAAKSMSLTTNADLPKRIGPKPAKTAAWHSR